MIDDDAVDPIDPTEAPPMGQISYVRVPRLQQRPQHIRDYVVHLLPLDDPT